MFFIWGRGPPLFDSFIYCLRSSYTINYVDNETITKFLFQNNFELHRNSYHLNSTFVIEFKSNEYQTTMPRSITPPNIPVPRPLRWTSVALSAELEKYRQEDSRLNEQQSSRNSNSARRISLDNDVMDSEETATPEVATQSVDDDLDVAIDAGFTVENAISEMNEEGEGNDSDDADETFLEDIVGAAVETLMHRMDALDFDEAAVLDEGNEMEMTENGGTPGEENSNSNSESDDENFDDEDFQIRKLQRVFGPQIPSDWNPHAPKVSKGQPSSFNQVDNPGEWDEFGDRRKTLTRLGRLKNPFHFGIFVTNCRSRCWSMIQPSFSIQETRVCELLLSSQRRGEEVRLTNQAAHLRSLRRRVLFLWTRQTSVSKLRRMRRRRGSAVILHASLLTFFQLRR